ncbi:hypothetical protein [Lysinibacillus fusiformis]|uniref:hypothetical protein n=1 Tax=Lysinibacillus fusiformis TaxID=28031 RepID=UPI003D01368F
MNNDNVFTWGSAENPTIVFLNGLGSVALAFKKMSKYFNGCCKSVREYKVGRICIAKGFIFNNYNFDSLISLKIILSFVLL